MNLHTVIPVGSSVWFGPENWEDLSYKLHETRAHQVRMSTETDEHLVTVEVILDENGHYHVWSLKEHVRLVGDVSQFDGITVTSVGASKTLVEAIDTAAACLKRGVQ